MEFISEVKLIGLYPLDIPSSYLRFQNMLETLEQVSTMVGFYVCLKPADNFMLRSNYLQFSCKITFQQELEDINQLWPAFPSCKYMLHKAGEKLQFSQIQISVPTAKVMHISS